MALKYIDELELAGKRVFIRADLNVPLDGRGGIADDMRIRAVEPTLRYALRNGARLIIASHLGRPKGRKIERFSMTPVSARLSEILGREVVQAPEVFSDGVRVWAHQLKDGDVTVLENLRFHPGETANDPELAGDLADLTEALAAQRPTLAQDVHNLAVLYNQAAYSAGGLPPSTPDLLAPLWRRLRKLATF